MLGQASQRQLTILNRGDYLAPEVVTALEQQHQAKVVMSLYSSDDDRTRLLMENDGAGCDLLQGYLFSRPRPAEEIEGLLSQPLPEAG